MIGNFYENQPPPRLDEVAEVYQIAFAGDPWYEVSRCVDINQRCLNGLSAVAIGATCATCDGCPTQPAYDPSDLAAKFKLIADTKASAWYTEEVDGELAFAALAWKAPAATIGNEKYTDPDAQAWLIDQLGTEEIGWLDEVFADSRVRPRGNLTNFKDMCEGLASSLGVQTLAFRTINPRLVSAAQRDFPSAVTVFNQDQYPDYRTFVILTIPKQKEAGAKQ